MIKVTTFDMNQVIDSTISGGALTKTRCTLQPEYGEGTVNVEQHYHGGDMTMWAWYGREIPVNIRDDAGDYPDPAEFKLFLESEKGQGLMQAVIDGYTTKWDGSNTIGRLTFDGKVALAELEAAIADLSRDEFVTWTCDEWFCGMEKLYANANSTPEEIAATAMEVLDIAKAYQQRLADDVTAHLTEYVNKLQQEFRCASCGVVIHEDEELCPKCLNVAAAVRRERES